MGESRSGSTGSQEVDGDRAVRWLGARRGVGGPDRVIRHPSYAGLLLVIMAVGLFIGSWWSLVCLTGTITGGLVFRIRVEERALTGNLGDRYLSYAATHQRLVPFIW